MAKRIIHLGATSGTETYLRKFLKKYFRLKDARQYEYPTLNSRCNAGDKALIETYKYIIEEKLNGEPIFMVSKRIFDERDLDFINSHDALILGGGGMFIHDSFPNIYSDWLWGVTEEFISKIKIPIFVYSVGYNKFRGQRDFTKQFDRTVTALLENSPAFALRHNGDVRKLKKHIPERLRGKVEMNFCPTLCFNEYNWNLKSSLTNRKVVFSLSGDRLGHRHGDVFKYVEEIKKFKTYLESRGYEVVYFVHLRTDKWILEFIKFDTVVELDHSSTEEILREYAKTDYVVSDRGHGQMLGFSVGCKIITPISHDKLKFFLEDIGLEKVGVEESAPNLHQKLIGIFNDLEKDENYKDFWKKTMVEIQTRNDEFIKKIKRNL
jgi:polysaccharide pyruvyl transferase WcaK-like protein